jgi:hypothetical protein
MHTRVGKSRSLAAATCNLQQPATAATCNLQQPAAATCNLQQPTTAATADSSSSLQQQQPAVVTLWQLQMTLQ